MLQYTDINEIKKAMGGYRKPKQFVDNWFKYNPKGECPRCNVIMIRAKDLPGYKSGKIKTFPDNTATMQHTHSRLNPNRGKVPNINTVLCLKCNNELGREEEASLPLAEKRKRASR